MAGSEIRGNDDGCRLPRDREALIAGLESGDATVATRAALELSRARERLAIPSLLRLLVNAMEPSRAHAAAEALSGLRVMEAVPLILDKIEDPVLAYYSGSLVFHLAELDCRAHLDRVAQILLRDGLECCMNAYTIFRHRRGPLAPDVRARTLARLACYADEYEAGGHRDTPSKFHASPDERYEIVAWAHDLVLEWNDRERTFPRQGENRRTGERTHDWTPISIPELRALIAEQLPLLDAEDRATWNRIVVDPPVRIEGIRQLAEASVEEPAEAICIAKAGDELLLYDDVQDVFATSRLADGTAGNWEAETENLDLLVHRFTLQDANG